MHPYPEDGGSMVLQNVGSNYYTTWYNPQNQELNLNSCSSLRMRDKILHPY
jgi:hypothetical protein